MSSVILPIDTANCVDLGGQMTQVCNITGYLCAEDPPGGWLVRDRASSWNESLCQKDRCFALPLAPGDKFMVQTKLTDFYNASSTMPDTGGNTDMEFGEANPTTGFPTAFRVTMRDACDDSIISQTMTDIASRYYAGWTGEESYQVFEADTSLAAYTPGVSFYFQIEALDQAATVRQTIYTQDYKISLSASCERTVLIQGGYPSGSEDCEGNFYGLPEAYAGPGAFRYQNTMRIPAELVRGSDTLTKEVVGNRRTSAQLFENFDLVLQQAIPDYLKTQIALVHLAGDPVKIDNRSYNVDNFSTSENLRFGRMWHFDITLSRNCRLNYRCELDQQPLSGNIDIGIARNGCCHPCFG